MPPAYQLPFAGSWRRLRRRLAQLDEVPRLARVVQLERLTRDVDDLRRAVGRVEGRQLRGAAGPLHEHEFRVYSQNGEDGIVQYLVNTVPIASRSFVEFGVEDYREANTRFLLAKDGWRGLVLDGDPENVARIQRDELTLRTGLRAVAAFITRENVNDVIAAAGFQGDLGLLSIDVDGNDYWVFDAVEVVQPTIAIVEYNHRLGPTDSVTIPYDASFRRRHDDASWFYAGASLAAIVKAASRKGLRFVGCNSFGNNAFFVREDLAPDDLPSLTSETGYVAGRFKETLLVGGKERTLSDEEEAALRSHAALVVV